VAELECADLYELYNHASRLALARKLTYSANTGENLPSDRLSARARCYDCTADVSALLPHRTRCSCLYHQALEAVLGVALYSFHRRTSVLPSVALE